MTVSICVAFHSGYGHTLKVAQFVAEGVKSAGAECHLLNVAELNDADWAKLDAADGIIFGSPCYMGSVSAKFKEFMEVASNRWFTQSWKDKVAAGFINSGGMSGDKLNALNTLYINAMQHSMIWASMGVMGAMKKGAEVVEADDINRIGSYSGLMTQSNNDSPDITPVKGDLETAKLFGARIAQVTKIFAAGRKAAA